MKIRGSRAEDIRQRQKTTRRGGEKNGYCRVLRKMQYEAYAVLIGGVWKKGGHVTTS